jgi:signal transduction histidine kinase
MKKGPVYKEPLSSSLRRHPQGDKTEITSTVRWVGYSAMGVFLAVTMSNVLLGNYRNALIIAIGIIPIVVSLILLKQDAVSVPSTVLAITIILLITCLATFGQGIYDIGVLGFPVILIVAGLILRGRMILYLALLIIVCMGWLVFGDIWNLYEPLYSPQANGEDFFIASIIILVAGNAVYRLARNVYHNLSRAEQENRMREEAENRREQVIEQLKRKNQELDRFAIRVSHDLKTPLITLAGFLGYLERDIREGNYERAARDHSQINEAAKTMGKFVDELLDLSRVGRIANPPTDVPFDEIVKESLKAAEGVLKARQVQVRVDSIFPFVHADRARIVQVMQNLISNAVKFMGEQPNPRIRIGFEEIDGEHIFSVSDNGIGIAPEHHERIFELFNKLDPATEGTGIGLGLVRKIVEAHGGRVWVESEPGKGAAFFFTLENKIYEETL